MGRLEQAVDVAEARLALGPLRLYAPAPCPVHLLHVHPCPTPDAQRAHTRAKSRARAGCSGAHPRGLLRSAPGTRRRRGAAALWGARLGTAMLRRVRLS